MKAAVDPRIASGDVVTVVGKLLAGRESRRFAHDLVALDNELCAVIIMNDPFSAQERDGSF